ncbi:MAG: hypothetical protein MK085_01320 [Phycisphaerales bacterium]|nr:hypothetical protein [Phycisphaerales bacterium]
MRAVSFLQHVLLCGLFGVCTMPTIAANDSQRSPGWEEVDDPEAGKELATAQRVKDENNGQGDVMRIAGSLDGNEGQNFVGPQAADFQDIYQIFIADPEIFFAGTTVQVGGQTEFDSMLWLMGPRGNALLANYRAEAGGKVFGSLMQNQSSDGQIDLSEIGPAIYYIGISGHPSEPTTEEGDFMFQPQGGQNGDTVGPSEAGANNPLGGWNPQSTPLQIGEYEIRFPSGAVRFIPAACGEATSGNCYEANGTPGCDLLQCCNKICFDDPYCCLTEWDQQCANMAQELCVTCGNPSTGPCDIANGTPYCDDAGCCQAVCSMDPICCQVEWDANCAASAVAVCGAPCDGLCPGDLNNDGDVSGGDLGILLARWNEVGCGDLNNDGLVDGGDLGLMLALFGPCSDCGRADTGDCYEPTEYIGCEDEECCEKVCKIDPLCCENKWDDICAQMATKACAGCGNPINGPCHEIHNTPGCNDPSCCELVCKNIPECCSETWDINCVEAATVLCTGSCGNPNNGSCFVAHGTSGCKNEACCKAVCEILPRCCEAMWDQTCVDMAIELGCPPG